MSALGHRHARRFVLRLAPRPRWYRPRLEQLEDRLPPGTALDWLLFPMLAPSLLSDGLAEPASLPPPTAAGHGGAGLIHRTRPAEILARGSQETVHFASAAPALTGAPFIPTAAPAPWGEIDFGLSLDPLTSAASRLPLVRAGHESDVANAQPHFHTAAGAEALPPARTEGAQPRFPFQGIPHVDLPNALSLLPPGRQPPPGVMSGPGGDQVLIAPDATWRYLDDGSDQGTAWRDPGFDDSAWASGPAELGYGDGDEATLVGYGPNLNDKYITTYFRHTFTVGNPSDFQSLQHWLLRDDGAVAYLNGAEIYRSNMPSGAVDYRTPAATVVGGADESAGYHTALPATGLQAGDNLLAVEIHQANPTSSDISFDLLLIGSPVVRFAVIGDFGLAGTPERNVANMVKSWYPDFVVTTGDNNYPNGEANTIVPNIGQYYCTFIRNPDAPAVQRCDSGLSTNRFYPSAGNHDWDSANPLRPYRDYFVLPGNERYYETQWGQVQFVAVDADPREPDGRTSGSVQGTWARDRLAASEARWKVVYMHHPPYSSGQHGNTMIMQWPYQQWGASAVLAGHDHTYERIIRNDFPYFVNGLGGNPSRYNFGTPVQGSEARYNANWGAQYVEASSWYLFFLFVSLDGYYDYHFVF